MRSAFTAFAYGLLLTGFATFVSWAIALWGFGNLYYLGQLLPIFMTLYLLLAWIIHLKKTAFLQPSRLRQRQDTSLGQRRHNSGEYLPEQKVFEGELVQKLSLHNENKVLPGRPADEDSATEQSASPPALILVWSACQLAVLATVLYNLFGIGARYFR